MADIAYWNDEYTKEVDSYSEISTTLRSLIDSNSTNVRKIAKTISDCEAKAAKIKDVRKSYGLELRLVKERNLKSEYDGKMKALDERAYAMNQELKLAKMKQNKSELFEESTGRKLFSTEGKDNDDLLDGANRIQDMTLESLARTRLMIASSNEVGTSTVEELRRQAEQIKDIEAEVDLIDSNLKRAEQLLFKFTRRMATDKLIQGFAAINIVVMLSLVLYIAISGKSLSASTKASYTGPSQASAASNTSSPTFAPTMFGDTNRPTFLPTFKPSFKPSIAPTFLPSASPSRTPTRIPTSLPSFNPSFLPSHIPSFLPTAVPISSPVSVPTNQSPSSDPATAPTASPS